ncbi:MAG: Ig-like domain-containing protein [Terracidiphilus sp.]
MIRRGLRLELVAAISIALAVPALGNPALTGLAQDTQGRELARQTTQTVLSVETHDQAGRTQAKLAITVTGEDSLPATGAVTISDRGRELAGAALNKQGQATLVLALSAGAHSLTAAYAGDAAHRGSISESVHAIAQDTTTPDFQVSVAPASLTLSPGQSGTVTASITPENSSALTAPMFVTLSCSGLPDQSSCTFTPENIEILPNATAAITSSMVILTQQQEGYLARPGFSARPGSNGVALAILLPGALGLGCLAWSVRRRPWLQRLSLLALVALVSMLGTTACDARYNYFNHGPPINPATPAGTYTVDVTAQSSNGVTATTHTTTLAFTVK